MIVCRCLFCISLYFVVGVVCSDVKNSDTGRIYSETSNRGDDFGVYAQGKKLDGRRIAFSRYSVEDTEWKEGMMTENNFAMTQKLIRRPVRDRLLLHRIRVGEYKVKHSTAENLYRDMSSPHARRRHRRPKETERRIQFGALRTFWAPPSPGGPSATVGWPAHGSNISSQRRSAGDCLSRQTYLENAPTATYAGCKPDPKPGELSLALQAKSLLEPRQSRPETRQKLVAEAHFAKKQKGSPPTTRRWRVVQAPPVKEEEEPTSKRIQKPVVKVPFRRDQKRSPPTTRRWRVVQAPLEEEEEPTPKRIQKPVVEIPSRKELEPSPPKPRHKPTVRAPHRRERSPPKPRHKAVVFVEQSSEISDSPKFPAPPLVQQPKPTAHKKKPTSPAPPPPKKKSGLSKLMSNVSSTLRAKVFHRARLSTWLMISITILTLLIITVCLCSICVFGVVKYNRTRKGNSWRRILEQQHEDGCPVIVLNNRRLR